MKAKDVFYMVIVLTLLASARPVAGADVNVSIVALLAPSSSDTKTALPSSVSSVPKGQDYYIEVWASDVGETNTGLTSVYVDVIFTPSSVASAQSISHGGVFTVFPSGTISAGKIDELGGSCLTATGIEPQWTRVATITMHADAVEAVSFSLTESSTGIAALGRGLIPWSQVNLGSVVVAQILRPSITQNPKSQTVCEGGSVTFTVSASGTEPLSYQWRKGSSNIPGANGSSYMINPVGSGDAGSYTCVVTNACGSATSSAATLTVSTVPVITDDPDNQTVCEGDAAIFTVSATSITSLSYQWRKGGSNISGATSSSYTINPVGSGDAGSYTCVVTNACGSVTSRAATLTVNTAPVITHNPDSQTVCQGGSATLTVSASGTAPLSYQWRKSGSNIPSATSSSYKIDPVGLCDAGSYTCVVTNICGSATSSAATLTVSTAPMITDNPDNRTVCKNDPATFTVSVAGTAPLSYQWRKGGSNIPGANSSSYTINAVSLGDAGNYQCKVTNSCGSVTSDTATLTVNTAPVITDDPDNQTVCEGDPAIFTVSATGTAPLSYQWRKDGRDILGATISIYVIYPADSNDAGYYQCVVTNSCGSVTSDTATLTVSTVPVIADDPDNQTVCEGDPAIFTVSATGTALLSYQWRKDGRDIPGATSSSYTIDPAGLDDVGNYQCVVTSSCGSVTSDTATLTVNTAPAIIQGPWQSPSPACERSSVTFTVQATGTPPLHYQWKVDDSNVGYDDRRLVLENVQLSDNGDQVSCEVSNDCGSVISIAVSLVVSERVIFYVDEDALGANSGVSWDDAFNYLQDAISMATARGGATTQIWVAGGTYRPDQGQYQTAGERAETFQLVNGVAIKGGYAGAGYPDPNARDAQLYETILSGDIGIVDDYSDNSYHVVTGSGNDNTAVLDGFTITGGNANVLGRRDGGGMYNYSGSPTIANCVFKYNIADNGAGMANIGGSPELTNCIFCRNSANISGGGIYNVLNSHSTLTNCTLSNNSAASSGGGIYISLSNPEVTNSILWNNNNGGITDESAQIHTVSGSPAVNYSCIQGLTGSLGGIGNIAENPCFVDVAADDYHLRSVGWRWDIITKRWFYDRNVTSRCIDAGNPGSPLHNEPLIIPVDPNNQWGQNLRIDMGAYGGTAQASMPPYDWALLADLTNDGTVDFIDFAYWSEHWLSSNNNLPGDFDRDGDVDLADLALFADDWLKQTSWHK